MAEIIFMPDQHRCDEELKELGSVPLDTVAQCSCGARYKMCETQFDGKYWRRVTNTVVM